MSNNAVGTGVKSPKPHANTAECVEIGHCAFTPFRGQHEDSSIREIAIPVRLSHASSPTVKLDFKGTHSGTNLLNQFVSTKWLPVIANLFPCDGYEVGYAQSIYSYLPCASNVPLVSSMMQCNMLAQVGPGKLNRKSGFCRRAPGSTSRQVPLGLTKSNLWHLKHYCTFHNTNIPGLMQSRYPN